MQALTDEYFERWWNTSVRASDSDEFVHGPWRGTLESARFCCVYEAIKGTAGKDLVVQSYVISQNLDQSCSRQAAIRLAAQGMFEEDAVKFLLDKIEYRTRAAAEERIHAILVAKIEELAVRAADNDFLEPDERLATEKVLLDSSLRFMADRTKQHALDMKRRERKALTDSIEEGKKQLKNVTQLPSKEEIKQFFQMAREMLTEKEYEELSGRKALTDG